MLRNEPRQREPCAALAPDLVIWTACTCTCNRWSTLIIGLARLTLPGTQTYRHARLLRTIATAALLLAAPHGCKRHNGVRSVTSRPQSSPLPRPNSMTGARTVVPRVHTAQAEQRARAAGPESSCGEPVKKDAVHHQKCASLYCLQRDSTLS